MKNLTAELHQQSIEKWDEIIQKIMDNDTFEEYEFTYWYDCECGFCTAACWHYPEYTNCKECSLSSVVNPYPICNHRTDIPSHAIMALKLADEEDWDQSLLHARIVLNAIKNTEIDP